MLRRLAGYATLGIVLLSGVARAVATFTVQAVEAPDEKAVFATVESRDVVAARARIGGTVTSLGVKQGDAVTDGQVIAVVTDPKLQLQADALEAQIAGLQSQLTQAQTDLARARSLAATGAGSREAFDKAETATRVASSALAARIADRAVVRQQMSEGAVLAPTSGRILEVPVLAGSVVLTGDTVATVAEQNYVLRLKVPEANVAFMKVGERIRFDGPDLGQAGPVFGRITLVYPQVEDGRIRADATAAGVGLYFVGERVRVWIPVGTRRTYVIPSSFVLTRFGMDFVRLRQPNEQTIDVPVQRGRPLPTPGMPDGLEILSGLAPGDVLVQP